MLVIILQFLIVVKNNMHVTYAIISLKIINVSQAMLKI